MRPRPSGIPEAVPGRPGHPFGQAGTTGADGAGARVPMFTACMGVERATDTVERWRAAEAELVVSWRFTVLFRAGYSRTIAFELARQPDVDLHLATELLERGCPVATAREILL